MPFSTGCGIAFKIGDNELPINSLSVRSVGRQISNEDSLSDGTVEMQACGGLQLIITVGVRVDPDNNIFDDPTDLRMNQRITDAKAYFDGTDGEAWEMPIGYVTDTPESQTKTSTTPTQISFTFMSSGVWYYPGHIACNA